MPSPRLEEALGKHSPWEALGTSPKHTHSLMLSTLTSHSSPLLSTLEAELEASLRTLLVGPVGNRYGKHPTGLRLIPLWPP